MSYYCKSHDWEDDFKECPDCWEETQQNIPFPEPNNVIYPPQFEFDEIKNDT